MSSPLPGRPALDSPLGRRHPVVKLALLVLVSSAVLLVWDPVTPAVLYLVALVAVGSATRVPLRTLALAHVPFVGFALGLLVVNALSRPGEVVAGVGPLDVTGPGLLVGTALAGRTLLVGVLSVGFLVSTDPVALVDGLRHEARLGARPAYALLAGYRMLEEMPRRWQTIRDAHRVRLPDRPGPRDRVAAWLAAAFGLLVTSVRTGERMSLALETRGVGLPGATTWRRRRIVRADVVMAVGVVAVLAAVLVAAAWLGVLRGPSVLTG